MLKVSFTHDGVEYVRTNRTKALKAFTSGMTLYVFGRMDNPMSPWSGSCQWVYDNRFTDFGLTPEDSFTKLENSFQFYNEKKPWWYVKSEDLAQL